MVVLQLEQKPVQLRTALDNIVASDPDQISLQPTLVSALRHNSPHSIEVATDLEVANIPIEKFTCFMHALGLAESKLVEIIASALPSTFVNGDFIAFIMACGHLESVAAAQVRERDIVLYWNEELISHAGKVTSGKVISKWGTGHLWKHDVFEVPLQYGDRVTFYQPLERSFAEKIFITYAKQREGATLVDQLLTEG